MNPHTLQTEFTRVRTERDNARALLALCLPYIEDCAGDPAYKGDRVSDLVRKIRGALA